VSDEHAHWDEVWREDDEGRSWFEPAAARSLAAVAAVAPPDAAVIDVGGGASRLVDGLLDRGHPDPVVADISGRALEHARRRLGDRAAAATFVEADVRTLALGRRFDVWHDRAVLHFLVDAVDREAYVEAMDRHLRVGGHAVVATFAPDGPTACSGLPVRRYDAEAIAALLGPGYRLVSHGREDHATPSGDVQPFVRAVLRREA
jgi:SAM-dependent methyltransferase